MRILCQVIMPRDTLIPADTAINTWAFATPSSTYDPDEIDAIGAALDGFYNEFAICLAGNHAADSWRIKAYNLADPEPRTPIADELMSEKPVAEGNPFPAEVAVCLSFRGPFVSGEPNARRRGRVFLGPLDGSMSHSDAGAIRPAPLVFEKAGDALLEFGLALGPLGITHSVWSRADDTLYPVVEYWMDDAFDTQRRRGERPSKKVKFP